MFDLAGDGYEFRLAVCGENFRRQPEEFTEAQRRLADRLVQFGYADEETYRRLLTSADVVVSTALHEFFGIAVVEAAYAGAFPVLPDRLSYPEIMPAEVHDRVLYGDGELLDRLRWVLTHPEGRAPVADTVRRALADFDWSMQAARYDAALADLT